MQPALNETPILGAVLAAFGAEDCILPMGITSGNVAADTDIAREQQDDFVAESFQRAVVTGNTGDFRDETGLPGEDRNQSQLTGRLPTSFLSLQINIPVYDH